MEFEKIKLSHKDLINSTLKESNISWEYCFSCLYVWNKGRTYVHSDGDVALFYMDFGNKFIFMPPFIRSLNVDVKKYIDIAYDYAKEKSVAFVMRGFSESFFNEYKHEYDFITRRNESDYVYNTHDLVSLAGKKYHSKRNFVNRFASKYDYVFREYVKSDFETVIALFDRWASIKDEDLLNERDAIVRALENYVELELKIGLLFVNGELVGFSIVDSVKNGIGHYLFEKASIEYEGSYQTLNYLTCKTFLYNTKYINRQEDMGMEGLRKSKLSYHPAIILDKYNIEK